MMTRRGLVALLPALALAACISPTPELFTLVAVPGPTRRLAAHSVELRRIGLAGYLDRPEIVRAEADYRVQVATNQRWGESLGTMLDRVFTEDLVERLPEVAVFAESGAISTAPDLILEIDVQRFDTDASGTLVVLAQVAVRRADARQTAHAATLRLTEQPASPATRDLVAAMSAALGQLADRVVAMLARA
ncbi:MAG: PqiC family protein [Rhodospirillales bacterium]|nr:PqiC family protein [Rhodospirillales bacterium]